MGFFSSKAKVKINVSGMTCNHCEMRVKNELMKIEGIQQADVSAKKNSAVIKLSKEIPENVILKAVEDAGYKASLAG
jgi:copper chaperone CopZ